MELEASGWEWGRGVWILEWAGSFYYAPRWICRGYTSRFLGGAFSDTYFTWDGYWCICIMSSQGFTSGLGCGVFGRVEVNPNLNSTQVLSAPPLLASTGTTCFPFSVLLPSAPPSCCGQRQLPCWLGNVWGSFGDAALNGVEILDSGLGPSGYGFGPWGRGIPNCQKHHSPSLVTPIARVLWFRSSRFSFTLFSRLGGSSVESSIPKFPPQSNIRISVQLLGPSSLCHSHACVLFWFSRIIRTRIL